MREREKEERERNIDREKETIYRSKERGEKIEGKECTERRGRGKQRET